MGITLEIEMRDLATKTILTLGYEDSQELYGKTDIATTGIDMQVDEKHIYEAKRRLCQLLRAETRHESDGLHVLDYVFSCIGSRIIVRRI
jgi:hypothetical protein